MRAAFQFRCVFNKEWYMASIIHPSIQTGAQSITGLTQRETAIHSYIHMASLQSAAILTCMSLVFFFISQLIIVLNRFLFSRF